MSEKISKRKYFLLSLTGIFLFIFTWLIITHANMVDEFFLPSPIKVFQTTLQELLHGDLIKNIFISIFRILIGFLISLIISFPLGIYLGISKKIEALIEPLIAFLRYIPPSAFLPLTIIWLGVDETQKYTLLVLGIAPYLTLMITDSIKSTREDLINAGLTLGAKKLQIITHIIIPQAMPQIWDAFRIMIGAGWTFVIISEIVGASSGIGFMMIKAQRYLQTDIIYTGIIVIGFIGILTDYLFKYFGKKLFPWSESYNK